MIKLLTGFTFASGACGLMLKTSREIIRCSETRRKKLSGQVALHRAFSSPDRGSINPGVILTQGVDSNICFGDPAFR
ncbi:MAG: hypothetical protein IV089_08195 [Thiobacillus sp.]|nr:hypothetical protein [Thiobacillus sp.]